MRECSFGYLKRITAQVLAVALTVTASLPLMAGTAKAENLGKNGQVREMTSAQIVEDMGLGYNIGNTFDSIGSFITATTPQEYEKAWGNDPVTKHFIIKVREGGFKTVRLPVSWAQWIRENNTIDPAYMSAIQQIVDWCMEEDMYVILNIHHDGGEADTSWIRKAGKDYSGISAKYAKVWSQIAAHFKDYGDHLIFESMNEVYFPDVDMSRQYEILNGLNQLFVDTVRGSGGNNAKRHLLIAGYNTDIKKTCDRRYHMPSDPAGRCILSIHYYSPSPFCVATHDVDWCTPVTIWGTEEDIAQVRSDLDKLAERFISKDTPVIIGEYGVLTTDNKDITSVHDYVKKVPELIMEYGMCPVLWDTSNAGDMKFIERNTGEFFDPVIRDNYKALSQKKAAGEIKKVTFNYPDYKEIKVPASPDGWVSIASFEPSKIKGIRFELSCSSGWDSYGGGGLNIDGWDTTISWEFNSVYDQITHIFTEEERSRLKDQIGVLIWWTDESQGGSRRDELSIKNNEVTLLYEKDQSVTAAGAFVKSGTGGGGGGGGKGGSGHSTAAGGSTSNGNGTGAVKPGADVNPGGTLSDEVLRKYNWILKKDRASAAEGDNTSGVTSFTLSQIQKMCPDYEPGDTIRLKVTAMSDGGYSFALQTTQDGKWINSDSWGPEAGNSQSWECTPDPVSADQNLCGVYLWYLGGSYFAFNIEAEVVKKAEKYPSFMIEKEEYTLEDMVPGFTYPSGKRIRLTLNLQKADAGNTAEFAGKIAAKDANGTKLSARFSNELLKPVLVGTLKDGRVSITDENGDPLTGLGIMVTGAQAEILEDDNAFAEFTGAGQAELPKDAVTKAVSEAETGEKTGLKVYYAYSGDIKDAGSISMNLVVNSDWGYGNSSDSFKTGEDEKGTYIWYECNPENVNYLLVPVWYLGEGSFKITEIAAVKEEKKDDDKPVIPPEETEEYEILVEPDENGNYYVPEDRDAPIGIKADFAFKEGANGGLIVFDDWSGGCKWINSSQGEQIILFDEDADFEKLSFNDAITEAKQVTFLYWAQEDGEKTNEKGIFALPTYQVPAAMHYTCGSGDYSNNGVAIYIGYKNSNASYEWTNVSWWVSVGKENTSDFIFDQQKIREIFDRAMGEETIPYIRFELGENDDDLEDIIFYYDHESDDDLEISENAIDMDTEWEIALNPNALEKVSDDVKQTEEKKKEEITDALEDVKKENQEETVGSKESEEESTKEDPKETSEEPYAPEAGQEETNSGEDGEETELPEEPEESEDPEETPEESENTEQEPEESNGNEEDASVEESEGLESEGTEGGTVNEEA